MNYEERKLEILKETSELLKEYKSFSKKVAELAKKLGKFNMNNLNERNKIDLRNTILLDEEMSKFTRLALALLYVENPNEEEIVEAMYEDVMKNKGVEEEIELPEPITLNK